MPFMYFLKDHRPVNDDDIMHFLKDHLLVNDVLMILEDMMMQFLRLLT